jgi:hypothetical protein
MPSRGGKAIRKPQRPDFAARDHVLGQLQEKVAEFHNTAKEKGNELDALQNEPKANSKLEACRRGLANTLHSKTQTKVSIAVAMPCQGSELSALPTRCHHLEKRLLLIEDCVLICLPHWPRLEDTGLASSRGVMSWCTDSRQ